MKLNIETAVDSLVKLVNDKKAISLEDASKSLGVPENILNEWAVFLEEDGILNISYKVTKPILNATKDIKKVAEDKEDFDTEKDNTIRKANYLLSIMIRYKLNPIEGIKSESDIRKLVLNKTKRTEDETAYAQKFVLMDRLEKLIQSMKNCNDYSTFKDLISKLEDIEKKRNIFETNFAK